MTVPIRLQNLAGNWQGTNQLWFEPDAPVRESAATAVFQLTAQGKFAALHYTWAYDGQPQNGLLLFGANGQQVDAAWVDSWHMQDAMMHCTGNIQPDDAISVLGSYAAPPGPDWGWRMTVRPLPNDQFTLTMHNISLEGEEMPAVEVVFSRQEVPA